jgi:hypothetical protein
MAIVSLATVQTYVGSTNANVTTIHNAVEEMVKGICFSPFESTAYTNELYYRHASKYLWLRKKPVIYISRIAVDREDAIKVKNVNTDASQALVRVDATNVNMVVEGGTGNNTSTLSLATHTTCTLLVAAINALSAYGWSAELLSNAFASYKTSIMFAQAINCTAWKGVQKNWQYLQIAGDPIDYEITDYPNAEVSIGACSWACVNYNAGYATIPGDITYFICESVKSLFNINQNDASGVQRWQTADISMTYATMKSTLPDTLMKILDNYIGVPSI